jgi:hypothetical protein
MPSLHKEGDASVIFLLELVLYCSHPEAYMQDSDKIKGVDPSKQHGCCDQEGVRKLKFML